jgi:hypothetical protein
MKEDNAISIRWIRNRSPRLKYGLCILTLSSALLCGLVLTSCGGSSQSSEDPFVAPGITPTPAPQDWLTIQTPIPYQPVENLHLERFPGIRIELPGQVVNPLLEELPDGGCLAVYLQTDDTETGAFSSAPQMAGSIRFGPDGSRVWERPLDMETTQGYLTDLCVFPDGSFAVTVRATSEGSVEGPFVDRLVRFDPFGELLWSTECGPIRRIFSHPPDPWNTWPDLQMARSLRRERLRWERATVSWCRDFLSTARVSDKCSLTRKTELAYGCRLPSQYRLGGCLAGRRRFFFGSGTRGSLLAGMF